DVCLGREAEHLDVEDAHAGVGEPSLDLGCVKRMDDGLARHRNQPQADVAVAGLRSCADLLVMRQLEDCERGETDRALHLASIDRKCRIIRSASGSMPVNRRNAPAAWNTAMPPPSSVRQPFARAARSSSVSMGK